MIDLNPVISIIKLNVNCLNILFKGRDYQNALKNQDPNLCYPEEVHLYAYIFLHSTDKKNTLLISISTVLDSLWRKIKCCSFLSNFYIFYIFLFKNKSLMLKVLCMSLPPSIALSPPIFSFHWEEFWTHSYRYSFGNLWCKDLNINAKIDRLLTVLSHVTYLSVLNY